MKTNYFFKKACLVIAAIAVSISVNAANQTVSINNLTTAATVKTALANAITAANGSGTVTVTGTTTIPFTGTQGSISITIPNNVYVKWQANLTYSVLTFINPFTVSGGNFEMESGSITNQDNTPALVIEGSCNFKLSGGTVSNTYTSGGKAFEAQSGTTVNIVGGTISVKNGGTAIKLYNNNTVNISGGTVKTTTGNAINMSGGNSTVNITGGTISVTGSSAVIEIGSTGNALTVSGNALIQSSTGSVISGSGNVTVSGTARVLGSSSRADNPTIYSSAGVTVSGSATVSAGKSVAIECYKSSLNVTGGTVSSAENRATKITCEYSSNCTAEVNISGGRVFTTETSYGSVYEAIYTSNLSNDVNITGGFVFAYGAGIPGTGNVINNNFTAPSATGVVVAWNRNAGVRTYTAGTTDHLTMLPAGSVKWATQSGKHGIRYANGNNTGFFEIAGVTVTAAPPITAVSNITGVNIEATAGATFILNGTVEPSTATNKTIVWSIKSAGATGASITGNTLTTTATGTVEVTATIMDGTAIGVDYKKDFYITVNAPVVPVTNITNVPTTVTARTPLSLTATVVPSSATNQNITWSISSAGATGASISGTNTLNTTSAGTVTVTATIVNGIARGTNFTKNFNITVNPVIVPVTNITNVPTTVTAGTPLSLTATVAPSSATNQNITWSISSAGATGASISGTNTLNTTSAGTVTVTATIVNGTATGTNYTKKFNITVTAGGTAGISTAGAENLPKVVGYYSTLGQKLPQEPKSGFYIIMYDNGKTEKVLK